MTLTKFIDLAEPEHILIRVLKNEVAVYEGKYYMYPKTFRKERIRKWHIENGVIIINLVD